MELSTCSRELINGHAPLYVLSDSLRDYGTEDCERFAELCDIQTMIRMSPENLLLIAEKNRLQAAFERRPHRIGYSDQFGPFFRTLTYHYEPTSPNKVRERAHGEMINKVVFSNFVGGEFQIREIRQDSFQSLEHLELCCITRDIDWVSVLSELNGANLETLTIINRRIPSIWNELVAPFVASTKIATNCELIFKAARYTDVINRMKKPNFRRY